MLPSILEGKKIFIIEDDPMSLSLISSCLLKHGARIEANTLGFDIIDHLVESMPVDLIILDVNLRKNLPGYQVLEHIRSKPLLCQVPVVMVTAADWEIALPKAKAAGANSFIAKPFNLTQFAAHIDRVLSGGQVWVTA